MMHRVQAILSTLLMIGLGGALFSSSILAGATALLALAGIILIARKSLVQHGWIVPKELRLMHFAFWFFVLVSFCSWVFEGFSYEGGKNLGTHARLILFWPLLIAISYSGVRARGIFTSLALISISVIILFLVPLVAGSGTLEKLLATRFGGGVNPISFGNIALLGGMLTLTGGLFFARNKQHMLAILLSCIGVAAVVLSMFSETRSNLVALPALLLLLLPLLSKKLRIAGAIAILVIAVAATTNSERMSQSVENLVAAGSFDRSMETRIEVWELAWDIFRTEPFTGTGLGGYTRGAEAALAAGEITPVVSLCCTGHAHNDILGAAATRGIPGILSWAFLIFIPLSIFGRHIFNMHAPTAHIAVAGSMVTTGYLLFGLTEATFERSLFLTFYLLVISGLASALFTELRASCYRERNVRVSATIIAKNEEDHIADCLQSARLVADEIIVLDSGSTDRTAEIAKQYADIVEVTDWPGFGIQKQRALEKATGDWVLSLDADERITPELAREINHHLADPDADAYKLPWAVTIYGKRLDFGRSGRAPLRLFRREGVRFSDALVHERILIPEGRKTRTLRGRLTHYTHRDFGHSLEKSAKYAWLGSQEKHRRGKRTRTMIYPTLRGLMTFIQVYFIRFGFLDGAVGYLTAVTYAQVTFNKYAGLWTLGRPAQDNRNTE